MKEEVGPLSLNNRAGEIRRIAEQLSAISRDIPVPGSEKKQSDVTSEFVQGVIRARQMRERIIRNAHFSDPSWDILLDLFVAYLNGHQISVSSACIAANVPPTTALRWITNMTEEGLLNRVKDPHDSRRALLELSESTAKSMGEYFKRIIESGMIVI